MKIIDAKYKPVIDAAIVLYHAAEGRYEENGLVETNSGYETDFAFQLDEVAVDLARRTLAMELKLIGIDVEGSVT